MSSSGTYAYNPAAADIFAAAFGMCGIRRTEITTQHVTDAAYHGNMVMVDFSNRNPNQWALETQTSVLTAGVSAYMLNNRTIAIASAYISTGSGSNINDRVISSMSATEYAAIPVKSQQGFPNSYWLNLANPNPLINIYYTPDLAFQYTLNLTTFRQMQDLNPANGQTLDAPYRFLDAFTTGLASRIAIAYPDPKRPNLQKDLEALYERRMTLASATDQENVNIYVTPGLQGYFR
jgi:hypothetical protein